MISNVFKKIIYKLITKLIIINLIFYKKFSSKNNIYFRHISFGDSFTNYIENWDVIKKKKLKVLVLSKLEKKIAELFFNDNQISKLFFLIPSFIPVYPVRSLLNKSKYFIPTKIYDPDLETIKVRNKHKNLLVRLLKKNVRFVSDKLIKFKKEKYFLISIKYFNNNKEQIDGAFSRQTSNLNKICEVINFLLKKKIIVIIMGSKFDIAFKILKKNLNKKILFFNDLSKSQSMVDQLFIHYYSSLWIGNPSGSIIISLYLKKKCILIDSVKWMTVKFSLFHSKNILQIFKKIVYDKKCEYLSDIHINKVLKKKLGLNNKYKIIENSAELIINKLSRFV